MQKPKRKTRNQSDSVYFLKLVIYLILGSLWVKLTDGQSLQVPIPVGFLVGLALIGRDRIRIDRKIGFAVLLVAMLIGFWAPFGIYVAI